MADVAAKEVVPDDIDQLLDDALEDFEQRPSAVQQPAPAAEASTSSTVIEELPTPFAEPQAQHKPSSSGRGLGFDPLGNRPAPRKHKASPPTSHQQPPPSKSPTAATGSSTSAKDATDKKLLNFDPLRAAAKPRGAHKGPQQSAVPSAEQAAPATVRSAPAAIPAAPAEVSLEDMEGLSQLLSQLASADGMGRSASGGAASAQPGTGHTDLAATLRALAEHTPGLEVDHGGGGGGGAGGEAAADSDPFNDPLMRRFAEQFESMGAQNGEGGAPEMQSLVESIMHQLLSKEVLYQPMKDIGSRYPDWLEAHKEDLSPEDLARYQQQFHHIQDICSIYEATPNDFPSLVEALQQMQACGQPPSEIVEELAPGLRFDADGLPVLPGGAGNPLAGLGPDAANCGIQ